MVFQNLSLSCKTRFVSVLGLKVAQEMFLQNVKKNLTNKVVAGIFQNCIILVVFKISQNRKVLQSISPWK